MFIAALLFLQAASHKQLRHGSVGVAFSQTELLFLAAKFTEPFNPDMIHGAVKASGDQFTGDPALAIVAGTGGGDYYTKAWTGENAGDATRGTGGCTAFRKTLQCNPSGPRDPMKDKGCQEVIDAHESGFCECGGYAQFAAVDCDHRPFTCEVMCVKFAVVTGKPAFYRNQRLDPAQAKMLLNNIMWGNQTDLEAMRMMSAEVKTFMDRALQHTADTADIAKASMKKFLDMMKVAREKDAASAKAEMDAYRKAVKDKPWLKIWETGGKLITAGRGIQAKVREVLPFDPLNAPDPTAGASR